ncbi:4606_t:CDS:2 [Ambispora gerdemannii]|uniref:4606_t:CDS:1 n=1 Tax=Ambispora gerdemannii TaxID=144530 RepID=A0A9N9C2Z8_9GLOM|nr:4606_t:CDS:2 [Ambispora gerdemannii]
MSREARNDIASFRQALVAGGIAGTAVDTVLFPLDTIKTRLQSKSGFYASGGFRGIYSGLTSAVVGSAPGASSFFVTYEYLKGSLSFLFPDTKYLPFIHMAAASGGELAACVVRVPTEIIKQRMQTNQYHLTLSAIRSIIQYEGVLGLYRGYLITISREIPFACLQFPLYEFLKKFVAKHSDRTRVNPWEAAICGSIAGGTAAAITTPLDVVKTRIMLSSKHQNIHRYSGIVDTLKRIWSEEGPRALFSGIGPRVMWVSVGGYIFLGVYEKAKKTLQDNRILT